MKKIKICGLKRLEDVGYVNESMPDYAGFVFAKSRRQVDMSCAEELCNALDKNIRKVGVFVNETLENIRLISEVCRLDVVQLHGEESPGFAQALPIETWKAFRIRTKEDLKRIEEYAVEGIVLDAFKKDCHGGSGEAFNWDYLKGLQSEKKIFLAGGIHLGNIGQALKIAGIEGIDVSSGVERDGKKDPVKIQKIIDEVRSVG